MSNTNHPLRESLGGLKKRLGTRAAAPLAWLFGRRRQEAFGILMYHRIADRVPGIRAPSLNVTPERFRRQIQGLVARGYRPWPLRKVIEHHRVERTIPEKTFVVTFDDGHENVYLHAWPILKELEVPATIFLATAYLDADRPFPFDRWGIAHHDRVPVETYRPLATRQCVEMLEDGLVELGAHTHTHDDFRGRPEEFRYDLFTSVQVLHRRFGQEKATFAFPFGIAGPDLAAEAREMGVECALTTKCDLVTPQCDPFDWGRLTVEQGDTAATLAVVLDGWYDFLRGLWRRMQPPLARTGASASLEQLRHNHTTATHLTQMR